MSNVPTNSGLVTPQEACAISAERQGIGWNASRDVSSTSKKHNEDHSLVNELELLLAILHLFDETYTTLRLLYLR